MALTAPLKLAITKLHFSVCNKPHSIKPQFIPQNPSLILLITDLIQKRDQFKASRSLMRRLIKDMTTMTCSIIHRQLK